jgi:hypothetical protein
MALLYLLRVKENLCQSFFECLKACNGCAELIE